ncbi:hypothetical protein LZC95_46485 [Pendulispora brunnea]|uniref:Uncharacterized protein n=1 Tax=Pendulispora brunnea TaxID=2905690 RepID=A0ABZ2KBX7_9BACT
MFFMLNAAIATDDGSAWSYEPDGKGRYQRVQNGPLSVCLLEDGYRVVDVGGEVLVDEELALEIERLVPESKQARRVAHVRGPQPEMAVRPSMLQLLGIEEIPLSPMSIVPNEEGTIRLKRPFVLDAAYRVKEPNICKIKNNRVTIFSAAIKDLLALREPKLWFEAVCYEGEDPPKDLPVKPVSRIPTREELFGGSKR